MDTVWNRMLNTGSVSSIVQLYFIYVHIHILFPICIHICQCQHWQYLFALYVVLGDIYVLATHAEREGQHSSTNVSSGTSHNPHVAWYK